MIDIKKIAANPEGIIENLNKRSGDYTEEITKINQVYLKYLTVLQEEENLKAEINRISKQIGIIKKEQGDVSTILTEVEISKNKLKELNSKEIKAEYENLLLYIPNILANSVPEGQDEESNKVIKKVGELPQFSFQPQAHFEIASIKTDFDFDTAAKISKSRFVITKNFVARLERALSNFMLDTHASRGYSEQSIPLIVSDSALQNSGQLPKFKYDAFKIDKNSKDDSNDEVNQEQKEFYLIPTAEVVLANLHQNEILENNKLPLKYVGYSQCFRKEVGSAGKDVTGIIRMHQFGKVELFKYVAPENSEEELSLLVKDAEHILQLLELPYQVLELCSGDLGFSANKTFDLEVWFPAQNKYRECSSCSNTGDFQARRGKVRYRDHNNNIVMPHLLNGSGMATGRILAAILENYQKEDGTVEVPKVLQKYFEL